MSDDEFFVGWAEQAPKRDRRFLLAAGLAALAGAAGAGFALGARKVPPGPGAWDQAGVSEYSGLLLAAPYPVLVKAAPGGVRTLFLGSLGKLSVAARLPQEMIGGAAVVRGSLIEREKRAMIAIVDDADAIRLPSPGFVPPDAPVEEDLGEALIAGEILDAKCWLGAMRPGWGKTHKACAALCAQGGLPLAFCASSSCAEAPDAPLFVDERGRAHAPTIIPYVGDPVLASGRLVRVGDVTQFRVAAKDLRRL